MLFKSEIFSATWDTWMFYNEGTYYLYYLITETGYGEGVGAASSSDGVRWEDRGLVIAASEKMVFYLGTGSVWKSPDFPSDRKFICNYSEWHMKNGKRVQNILFAWSHDLIHWTKYGDAYTFEIDTRFYSDDPGTGARWDSINAIPRPEGGYYGYWTARPRNFKGFGFGESSDGVCWKALEPPLIEWGGIPEYKKIEIGGVWKFGDLYYCLMGSWNDPNGMFTFEADNLQGPFRPAYKNHKLMYNRSFYHTFFTRFLETPGGILVNHHSLLRESNAHERPITYFAPLKKAVVDKEGTLRLMWWEGNEAIKGRLLPVSGGNPDGIYEVGRGVIFEGDMALPGVISIGCENNARTEIRISTEGITEVGYTNEESTEFICEETVDREVPFGRTVNFRLLLKGTMLEFYLNDMLIACYTMKYKPNGYTAFKNRKDAKAWKWSI